MTNLSDYFTKEQIDHIVELENDCNINLNSNRQLDWLMDTLDNYAKHGMKTYCTPATKDFLTRILDGFYSQESDESLWNYKG